VQEELCTRRTEPWVLGKVAEEKSKLGSQAGEVSKLVLVAGELEL